MSNSDSTISSTLKAVYDPSARVGNLEVVLTIKTESGTQRQFKKVYNRKSAIFAMTSLKRKQTMKKVFARTTYKRYLPEMMI